MASAREKGRQAAMEGEMDKWESRGVDVDGVGVWDGDDGLAFSWGAGWEAGRQVGVALGCCAVVLW